MPKPDVNIEQIKKVEDFIAQVKTVPAYAENAQVRALVDENETKLWKVAMTGSVNDLLTTLKGFKSRLAEVIAGPDAGFLETLMDCEKQYQSQLDVARKSGLFDDHLFGKNTYGVMVPGNMPNIVRGKEAYLMPSWDNVKEAIVKNKEIIEEKHAQGFNKMLIVPFGYDLKTMAERFKAKVRELDETVGIYGAGGEKVDFKKEGDDYPVFIRVGWDESQLVYYPKQYTKEDHGGLTKEDTIKINGAWQICFVEDMPVIPLEGIDVGVRRQIGRNGNGVIMGKFTDAPSIAQYNNAFKNVGNFEAPPNYRHETGVTSEQYLWMQLTSLLAKEKPVLMDYQNNEYRGTYLMECFNISSLVVPMARWDLLNRQLYLVGNVPGYRNDDCGVRSSVNIHK